MGTRAVGGCAVNFAVDDVHRSLRRYVSQMLMPPWVIRTERQPMTPDQRNVAVVEPASPVTTGRHRTSIPQGNVEKMMAFSVMAYPELGGTSAESRVTAQGIADLLDAGFSFGLIDDEGINIGGPFRVPVYDFEGVPVNTKGRRGGAVAYGYAWVEDGMAVRPIQDPLDPLRFTVACDLRLSWERGGRLVAPAPAASGGISGTFAPPSP